MNYALSAWKALQSVAIVTGDEVLGRNCCSNSAWKAVRLLRCTNCMSCGVVPSRHIVQFALIRALRTRLLSLRSVVPSRHKRSFSTDVWRLLGIVQAGLASALALYIRQKKGSAQGLPPALSYRALMLRRRKMQFI